MNKNPETTTEISRRDFLVKSTMVGAGLVFAPTFGIAQNTGTKDLNIALIGVGAQGRILLEAMQNIPNLRFKAVCDIWEYAQKYAINKLKKAGQTPNGYTDYQDMLAKEKDLDAVIIATPDFWHAPQTVDCLKAGLHVYCEKMMSNTVEGARSMAKAMQETGKLLQIGHHRRSSPRYIHVLENLIKKAKLQGRMTAGNAQWNRAVAEDLGWPKNYVIADDVLKKYGYKDMRVFRNWRWFKDLSGGPISDLGAHQIDIFNWYFQCRPKSVMAGGGSDYYKDREHYDNVMAIYEYPGADGPIRAFYQVLTTTSYGGGYYESFIGDQGTIKISENPRLTKIYRENNAPDWAPWLERNYVRQASGDYGAKQETVDKRESKELVQYEIPVVFNKPIHQPHLENFFSAVRGSGKLNCDGVHAFESEVAIFKVNPAVVAQKMLLFTEDDYKI